MQNQVFAVIGDKISSLIIDNESLKFSSGSSTSFDEFMKKWNAKVSLSKKHEIKIDKIKSIYKEENNDEIVISYKSLWGLFTLSKTWDFPFQFKNPEHIEPFLSYFAVHHSYYKVREEQTPLQAIKDNLVYLLIALGATYLGYNAAFDIEHGIVHESTGKTWIFRKIAKILGTIGVLIVGGVGTAFILFKIWKRYLSPPKKIKFVAPNAS